MWYNIRVGIEPCRNTRGTNACLHAIWTSCISIGRKPASEPPGGGELAWRMRGKKAWHRAKARERDPGGGELAWRMRGKKAWHRAKARERDPEGRACMADEEKEYKNGRTETLS